MDAMCCHAKDHNGNVRTILVRRVVKQNHATREGEEWTGFYRANGISLMGPKGGSWNRVSIEEVGVHKKCLFQYESRERGSFEPGYWRGFWVMSDRLGVGRVTVGGRKNKPNIYGSYTKRGWWIEGAPYSRYPTLPSPKTRYPLVRQNPKPQAEVQLHPIEIPPTQQIPQTRAVSVKRAH